MKVNEGSWSWTFCGQKKPHFVCVQSCPFFGNAALCNELVQLLLSRTFFVNITHSEVTQLFIRTQLLCPQLTRLQSAHVVGTLRQFLTRRIKLLEPRCSVQRLDDGACEIDAVERDGRRRRVGATRGRLRLPVVQGTPVVRRELDEVLLVRRAAQSAQDETFAPRNDEDDDDGEGQDGEEQPDDETHVRVARLR